MKRNSVLSRHQLHIGTGAPGSGKSTALEAFIRCRSHYSAFDMDWLLAPASALAGKDIRVDVSAWPSYNALWLEVLYAVHKNKRTAVLFAPINTDDLPIEMLPAWCSGVEWLLLDCPDAVRRARLSDRPGWTDAMTVEAEEDARVLRETIPHRIDTGKHAPDAVAGLVLDWLNQANGQK